MTEYEGVARQRAWGTAVVRFGAPIPGIPPLPDECLDPEDRGRATYFASYRMEPGDPAGSFENGFLHPWQVTCVVEEDRAVREDLGDRMQGNLDIFKFPRVPYALDQVVPLRVTSFNREL